VVCLLKLKMEVGLHNLIPDGMCSLCDFEEDVRTSQQAIPQARAVIVLLSSGTLTSSLQLSIAAWATKARNAGGTPDVIPVSIPGFVFPTEDFFSKSVPKMVGTGVKLGFNDATECVQVLREFFWSTRTMLSTRGSEQVMDQEVQDLLSRMHRGPRRSTFSRSTVTCGPMITWNSNQDEKEAKQPAEKEQDDFGKREQAIIISV